MKNKQHKTFDEISEELVKNLNTNVMLDHLDFVEEGIRPLDNSFYKALRIREDLYPNGKFLKISSKIERAICTAGLLHRNQYRKGADFKKHYISHPLSVAEILAKHTDDENILCAGILHDTLEDTNYTKENMIDDFGEEGHDEKIFNIVNDVTEQDKSLSWDERKRLGLEHIKLMSRESLLVKSADVLHNLTSQINEYEVQGDKLFEKFNAPKQAQLKKNIDLISELKRTWAGNPLISELEQLLDKAKKLWS